MNFNLLSSNNTKELTSSVSNSNSVSNVAPPSYGKKFEKIIKKILIIKLFFVNK